MSDERCNRCHRKLKTPEAIEVGFGSACYKKLFGKTLKTRYKNYSLTAKKQADEERTEIEGQLSIFDESEVLNNGF